MEPLPEGNTHEADEDFPMGYEYEYEEEEEGQYVDEEMESFRQTPLGALLDDVDEVQVGHNYGLIGERRSTVTVLDEEFLDPDEEDFLVKTMPMEIHPLYGAVVYRYYTKEEAAKRERRQNKLDKLLGSVKRPEIIKDDDYYALYEIDKEEGDETSTRDKEDLSLADRNLEDLALTPEERAFERPKVATPLLQARILQMNPTPVSTEGSLDKVLKNYVELTKAARRRAQDQGPPNPQCSQRTLGNAIDCEEEFRFKPGDILMFLEERVSTNSRRKVPRTQSYINIHQDMNYFEDYGQYRLNFMDMYGPLFDGDMVVRIGNFNQTWRWNHHNIITFYVYFNEVKPSESENCCDNAPHPWYSIEQFRLPQRSQYPKSREFVDPVPRNTPVGEVMTNFKLRDGDLLITNIWDTQTARFDRMKTYTWNPLLASIGEDRLINTHDRVLRYGVIYHKIRYLAPEGFEQMGEEAEIQAELYTYVIKNPTRKRLRPSSRHEEASTSSGKWYFMGSESHRFWESFMDRTLGKIKTTQQVPLAGDVVFDRGLRFTLDPDPAKRSGPARLWFEKLRIGGLVSFHTWEMFKSWGREPRPYVRFTDVGKYGVGDTTMVLRFGTFKEEKGLPDTPTWIWRERNRVELYLLNTRGSSWRRVSVANWSDCERPMPNYDWQQYDMNDVSRVSPWFRPQPGDVIIRLRRNHTWISIKSDPESVGDTYNPHYDVTTDMGIWGVDMRRGGVTCQKGDFLVRAGYESNDVNPTWTNATVELYYHHGETSSIMPWKFWGRDAYIFGTNYLEGGLKDVTRSGFGNLSVHDVEKLNKADREKFLQVDPSEVWKEKTIMQALREP